MNLELNKFLKVWGSIILWLLLWNRMNLEVGGKVIGYFFPNVMSGEFAVFYQSIYLIVFISLMLVFWKIFFGDFDFFYLKKRKYLWGYLLVVGIFISVMIFRGDKSILDVFQFLFSMLAISFSQDVLTFGILQSYLEKVVNAIEARNYAILMFFIGHTGFFPMNFVLVFYIVGFILFGLLREKDKNIYRVNILHSAFNLGRWFF